MGQLPRKFVRELLILYRKKKCLWHPRSPHYKNRRKRAEEIHDLVKMYRRIDPAATAEDVKKRLDGYRTTYRRELRRAKAAAAAGREYTVRLWYFDLLSFLHEQTEELVTDCSENECSSDKEQESAEDLEDCSRMLSREFISEFIQIYRDNTCLWKSDSEDFTNRAARAEAYSILEEKYREFEPTANIEMVKQKIQAMRTSYRRELRKWLNSTETYVPNLWYFPLLVFLNEHEYPELSKFAQRLEKQKPPSLNGDIRTNKFAKDPGESLVSIPNLSRKFITEFISLYRDQECLWDHKSKNFTSKKARAEAYAILVEKFREVDPNADERIVKTKFECLRSSYRREMKKVRQSAEAAGDGNGRFHVPSLWYFPLLTFLNEEYCAELSESITTGSMQDSRTVNSDCNDDSLAESTRTTERVFLTSSGDIFDLVGQSVACKLRLLKTKQRIHAEKLISDVLYHAELEHLDRHSTLLVTDPEDKLS